jgi:tRNA(Ile2) C34 agmatinyltransferase TiaS
MDLIKCNSCEVEAVAKVWKKWGWVCKECGTKMERI